MDKELKKHQLYFNQLIKNQDILQLNEKKELYYHISVDDKEWTIKHILSSLKNERSSLFHYLIHTDMTDIMNERVIDLLIKQQNVSYFQSFIDGNHWNWNKKNITKSKIEDDTHYYLNSIFWKSIAIGNIPGIQFGLDNGIAVYDEDYDNQPLDEAVDFKQKEVIDFLVSQGAPLDGQDYLALRKAFQQKEHQLFFHLLELGASLDTHIMEDFFHTPIYSYSNVCMPEKKYLNITQQILPYLTTPELRADLLVGAVAHKAFSSMIFLLEQNTDVFSYNSHSLRVACHKNDIKAIKILMDYGANPDLVKNERTKYISKVLDVLDNYPRNKAFLAKLNRDLAIHSTQPKHKL